MPKAAAQAKTALLEESNPQGRKRILNAAASSKVWRDFYQLLPPHLKIECWYCEIDDVRADNPVDHFRPKNRVEESRRENADHEGYWWLAFDWDNYRCACTYCNSRRKFDQSEGGKACKFPITDPDCRACCPDDELEQEEPDFLDPFHPDDYKLLWFDKDGQPEPKPGSNEDEVRKVNNSVDIFHLHQSKIVRERNRIRINVERCVKDIKASQNVNESKNTLRRMVRDTERLSRAAVVYLSAHRELDAVKEILNLD